MNEDASIDAVVARLEETEWRPGRTARGVEVSWGHPAGSDVIGYRTTTRHDVPVETVARFFGEGMLEAFEILNRHFAFAETLSDTPRVVRTGFTLPWPLAPREFVHGVVEGRAGDAHVVAYVPYDDPALPLHAPGWVRCPIEPSGQRIVRDADGRTRVEHLMTYRLGGRISVATQNRWFHRGHLGAYVDEWARLGAHLAAGGSA